MDSDTVRIIGELVARVEQAAASEENQRRRAHWERYWAGTPSGQDPEGPLHTMDIGLSTYARLLGFDIRRYYLDTAEQIRRSLEMRLWHFEHLDDESPIGAGIGINPIGCVLEPSMLGVPCEYPPDLEPWALHDHVIVETEAELDALPMPDFRTSGAMPDAFRMYDEAQHLLERVGASHWHVGFPAPIRGILGLAQALRGPHENIVWDMIERPTFADKLMAWATEFRIWFAQERAKFLGEEIGLGHIGNDEVTVPYVSPKVYERFMLPWEIKLSEFHGGLSCWHSCGTTTPLLELIRRIPNVHQFYTGPWTDVDRVVEVFGAETPVMIAVNTVDDVMAATPEAMAAKVRWLAERCQTAALQIRGGAMNAAFDLEHDVQQMIRWCRVTRETLAGRG